MSEKVIVFIPGIMGSSLLYKGKGPEEDFVEQIVWGENLADLLFGRKLQWLGYPTRSPSEVVATNIIERFGFPFNAPNFLHKADTWELYASLLNHLRIHCNHHGISFLEFPYDWRQSIRTTAGDLATYLLNEANSNKNKDQKKRFSFVGHSMGGLICRLAVASSPELNQLTDKIVLIASPTKGSIKAFHTLKIIPSLSPVLDWIINAMGYYDILNQMSGRGKVLDAFMLVIRSFPSVYELMPSVDQLRITTINGQQKNCLDPDLWPNSAYPLLNGAQETHQEIKQACNRVKIPIFSLYSNAYDTDDSYKVGGPPNYLYNGTVLNRVNGDQTVTAFSATSECPQENRYREYTQPFPDHTSICKNPNTLSKLHDILFS